MRVRQAATLEFLRRSRRVPCADCGRTFEPYQMDFDHRTPAEKSFNVTAGRAMLMSRDRLMAEIAKCDIVCANCHAMRTYAQQSKLAADRRALGMVGTTPRARSMFLRSHVRRDLLLRLRDRPCFRLQWGPSAVRHAIRSSRPSTQAIQCGAIVVPL